jgi:WXG100 family type VII secretion target
MSASYGDGNVYMNYNAVESVEEALTDATQSIGTVLEELQQTISTLQGSWSGASETEYTACQTRWNGDMAQMGTILNKYNTTLGGMKYNTMNTDNGLALQWQQIG